MVFLLNLFLLINVILGIHLQKYLQYNLLNTEYFSGESLVEFSQKSDNRAHMEWNPLKTKFV